MKIYYIPAQSITLVTATNNHYQNKHIISGINLSQWGS